LHIDCTGGISALRGSDIGSGTAPAVPPPDGYCLCDRSFAASLKIGGMFSMFWVAQTFCCASNSFSRGVRMPALWSP
jgi:hypothetical protein